MCLSHDKDVVVLCGISKVTEEGLKAKYTADQLKKITVIDISSKFGSKASLNDTQNCLRKICEGDLLS